MKRVTLVLVVVALAVALGAAPVLAKGPTGPSGKSDVGHLYLVEKDPTTWEVVEDGAWGKLNYKCNEDGFSFVFNGHGLEPGAEYELMNYVDPWPGNDSQLLAAGAVDEDGNIHLKGSVDCLRAPRDAAGAKIWLVLADDFDEDEEMMVGWNPTEYLFEYDLTTCCACADLEQ